MTTPVRFIAVMIVLLALMVRVAVPAGFMPELTEGKIAITICHGADMKTIWVDSEDAPAVKKGCPFTPIAQTASVGQGALVIAAPLAYAPVDYIALSRTAQANITPRAGLSRAPPVTL